MLAPQILEFIKKERMCALTTILLNGAPHAAALHFSHQENPFEFFVQTTNKSKKVSGLLDGETGKASMVIGFSEQEWLTFQMDGNIKVVTDQNELTEIHKTHYAKHPDAEQWKDDPETVFLKFIPTWWRFTDFNTKPETIIEK